MSGLPALRAALLRRRRLIAGIVGAVVLYALAGFLLAPWLVRKELVAVAREELGRAAEVERVQINPFTLRMRIRGFRLKDTDGSNLIGLDDLVVNFEAESLLRRAWTFSEVRLGGPYLNVKRDHEGGVNLTKLVPPATSRQPEPEPSGLPRLIVRKFALGRGVIDFDDRVPAEGFNTRVGPFGIELEEFSTLPDETGKQNVAITFESGSRLGWSGSLAVTPLASEGELSLAGPFLGLAQRYLRQELPFTIADGSSIAASAHYRLTGAPGGGVAFALKDFEVTVSGVDLSAPEAPSFLAWSELRAAGGEARWPAREASLGSVTLTGLRAKVNRAADGTLDVVRLLTPAAGETAAGPDASARPAGDDANPWKLRIGEVALRDLALELTDAGPKTPASLTVADLDLTLRDVSNEPDARFPLQASVALGGGGTVNLEGTVAALPAFALDGNLKIDGLKLDQAQPYVSDVARIGIRDGVLVVDGHVTSGEKEQLAFDGDIRVLRLDTQDLVRQQNLVAWSELDLDDAQIFATGGSAKIARARLVRPFGRIFIAPDKTTNIGALFVEEQPGYRGPAKSAPASAAGGAAGKPFRVRVGKVVIANGEADFTDLSLPLPFAARVQDLKGELTTIDTGSKAPSRISLEGRVDEFGLARVNGEIRISAPTELADIGVLFRNIEMPPLSPYTVEFAGRKIARGKIDLDLRYKLDNRQMAGSNKIVIDELELGEKVPSPDAMDLPLGLAVALLKDADGRIDLDMPVSGSLDDPEFGVGKVIWKAFVNLITKVVTAPFRLLGSLLGIESEDLGKIEFSPGRSDLLPPEKEKLMRIVEALGKRPNLSVEIPAVVDPAADGEALRTAKMAALVDTELAASGKPETGRGLEKRTRKAIEDLFERQFPGERLDPVREKFTLPPPEDPAGKPRLDELAYLDELRRRIAAAQVLSDAELAGLGTARAEAVRAELAASGAIPADRLRVGERKEAKARDGAWIPVELSLAAPSQ